MRQDQSGIKGDALVASKVIATWKARRMEFTTSRVATDLIVDNSVSDKGWEKISGALIFGLFQLFSLTNGEIAAFQEGLRYSRAQRDGPWRVHNR